MLEVLVCDQEVRGKGGIGDRCKDWLIMRRSDSTSVNCIMNRSGFNFMLLCLLYVPHGEV